MAASICEAMPTLLRLFPGIVSLLQIGLRAFVLSLKHTPVNNLTNLFRLSAMRVR